MYKDDLKNTRGYKMKKTALTLLILGVAFIGCSQNQPKKEVIDNRNSLTLGQVQQHVKIGTTKSSVASMIGSPNMISTEQDREIWIYDKISKEQTEKEVDATVGGLGVFGSGLVFGGVSGGVKNTVSSSSTLTVVITFNSYNEVEKVNYHSSKF